MRWWDAMGDNLIAAAKKVGRHRMGNRITAEEWTRIQKHIADGPNHVYLHTDEHGTCVMFDGGCIHPKAYLDLMEETEPSGQIDILKTR